MIKKSVIGLIMLASINGCVKTIPLIKHYCPKSFQPSDKALDFADKLELENFRGEEGLMRMSKEIQRIKKIYDNKKICHERF